MNEKQLFRVPRGVCADPDGTVRIQHFLVPTVNPDINPKRDSDPGEQIKYC